MTLKEMEKTKEHIDSKKLGLGHFDSAIVNFLIDDEEPMAVASARKQAFKSTKTKPVGNYDYIFNRSKTVNTDGTVFGEIYDDTDIDLCKVMQKLQIDRERDEVF